jgi:hypothetical protein
MKMQVRRAAMQHQSFSTSTMRVRCIQKSVAQKTRFLPLNRSEIKGRAPPVRAPKPVSRIRPLALDRAPMAAYPALAAQHDERLGARGAACVQIKDMAASRAARPAVCAMARAMQLCRYYSWRQAPAGRSCCSAAPNGP